MKNIGKLLTGKSNFTGANVVLPRRSNFNQTSVIMAGRSSFAGLINVSNAPVRYGVASLLGVTPSVDGKMAVNVRPGI